MLAGVGGVDACMFVVDAGRGVEAAERGAPAHPRTGRARARDRRADQGRPRRRANGWQLQELDVRDRLHGSFLADAPIVPVSATTGDGLDELRAALDELVQQTPAPLDRGRPRLWVDRVFAAKGSGTVVTGTLTGGALRTDQQVSVAGRDRADSRLCNRTVRATRRSGPATASRSTSSGVDHTELQRGDAVVVAEQWRPTSRFDASLRCACGAAPSGDSPRRVPRLHRLGRVPREGCACSATRPSPPAATGSCDCTSQLALPLVPGDRYVLRESGRDETVGGGEVLDVAPVLPASKARPDRSVERVIAERGWVDADELEALTGERREPTIGHGVVSPDWLHGDAARRQGAHRRGRRAGLDLAELDDRQRAVAGDARRCHDRWRGGRDWPAARRSVRRPSVPRRLARRRRDTARTADGVDKVAAARAAAPQADRRTRRRVLPPRHDRRTSPARLRVC